MLLPLKLNPRGGAGLPTGSGERGDDPADHGCGWRGWIVPAGGRGGALPSIGNQGKHGGLILETGHPGSIP